LKKRRMKLSLKIVLMNFLTIALIYLFFITIFRIARAFGLEFPESREEFDLWMRYIIHVFPIIFGIFIISLSSYVINRKVVSRILKLKDATAQVASGNFHYLVKVKSHDELSELTDSFNKMTAELQANEFLSKDFVRNISHEFKTPLAVLKAYGELVESEANQENIDRMALRNYSEIIMKEVDRLTLLSKSILELSLLDSTTIIKKDDIFSPAEQIRSMLRTMQVKWLEKNIHLDLDLAEETIQNNEQMLYQLWQNLISNAIKFSPKTGRISISLKFEAQKLYFQISDQGIGIAKAEQEKIFNQFYMIDKSRNREGTGLGLAIVGKILEKLDGKIYVESTENAGTTFKISLKQ